MSHGMAAFVKCSQESWNVSSRSIEGVRRLRPSRSSMTAGTLLRIWAASLIMQLKQIALTRDPIRFELSHHFSEQARLGKP